MTKRDFQAAEYVNEVLENDKQLPSLLDLVGCMAGTGFDINNGWNGASGTESRVCADITDRQMRGIAKYGQTVAENPLSLKQWLQHAYEECLDQAIYLKRSIEQIELMQAESLAGVAENNHGNG